MFPVRIMVLGWNCASGGGAGLGMQILIPGPWEEKATWAVPRHGGCCQLPSCSGPWSSPTSHGQVSSGLGCWWDSLDSSTGCLTPAAHGPETAPTGTPGLLTLALHLTIMLFAHEVTYSVFSFYFHVILLYSVSNILQCSGLLVPLPGSPGVLFIFISLLSRNGCALEAALDRNML